MTTIIMFWYNGFEEISTQELSPGDLYLGATVTAGTDATVTYQPSSSV